MKVVSLGMACVGASEALTLTPYYKQESSFLINNSVLNNLNVYAVSNATLWEPLHRHMPELQPLDVPRKLGSVKEMQLGLLIVRLGKISRNDGVGQWAWWKVALCGAGLSVCIITVLGTIGLLVKYKLLRGALSIDPFTRWCRRRGRASTSTLPPSAAGAASVMSAAGATVPSTDGKRDTAMTGGLSLYPPLINTSGAEGAR